MDSCRCCGSNNIMIIDNGIYAPFFCYKVPAILKDTSYKRFKKIQHSNGFSSIIEDATSVLVCLECDFISPLNCFSHEDLNNLYDGYRNNIYNSERVCFEPDYHQIAAMLDDINFIEKRINSCWGFLQKNLQNKKFDMVCDFGGADGKLVPSKLLDISNQIIINDVSGVELCNKNFIKSCNIDDETIDLALCMHVLEHLGDPSSYFKFLLSKVKKGGYLYIELPLEIDHSYIENVKSKNTFVHFHEHINKFCEKSLKQLAIKNNTIIVDYAKLNDNIAILLQKKENL